jgi:hypothetical protein
MIEVKTYLKTLSKHTFALERAEAAPDLFFVSLKDQEGIIDRIIKVEGAVEYYSRGSIIIENNYDKLISYSDHDLIIPLWWNFIVGLRDYLDNKKAVLSFQDKGMDIHMQQAKNQAVALRKVKSSTTVKTWLVDENEFLKSFLIAAKYFYNIIPAYSSLSFDEEIQYLNSQLLNPRGITPI